MISEKARNRFLKNVRKGQYCWEWTASKNRNGYGKFYHSGKHITAHRFAYLLANNELPENLCVLHSCDNPSCVNPAHLWLGTIAENNADRNRKNRQCKGDAHWSRINSEKLNRGPRPNHWTKRNPIVGEKHYNSRLTEHLVREIRSYYDQGCRIFNIATFLGMATGLVTKIVHRKTWKHI